MRASLPSLPGAKFYRRRLRRAAWAYCGSALTPCIVPLKRG
jgi:hypothetical protein